MKPKPSPEKRAAPPTWRRQFNEAWCTPDGSFSPVKAISIFGQIMLLYYTGRFFEVMLDQPETLLICLGFIIMPDVVKKLISMKYGNGHATK